MTTADVPATDIPEPQEYPWRLAPAHLRTRRQLRAAGLQPNRQPVAALMVGQRRGRRLVAHLFDIAKAAPKKPPSPAQLAATQKAVRAHQANAAERHGIDRDELTRTDDPGPGWDTTPETTHTEEITMSDNTIPAAQPQLGVATGHGQRIAHLLAVAAVNQARRERTQVRRDYDEATQRGTGAVELFEEGIGNHLEYVRGRLSSIAWTNRWSLTGSLAEALTWHDGDEVAAEKLGELRNAFAGQWGVVIDPEQMQVSIDPEFDPTEQEAREKASALFARESSVIDFVSAMPIAESVKGAAVQAVLDWRGEDHDIDVDPGAHLASVEQRRAGLATALDAAGVTGADRARLDFVVDYLRGDTTAVDLLQSPVYVDPGEVMRGQVGYLLKGLDDGTIAPKRMTEEISVMTAADQQTVRDAWTAFKKGESARLDVWPGHIDRETLTEDIQAMARNIDDLTQAADYIVDTDISKESPETIGVNDDIEAQIQALSYASDQLLDQARDAKGLAPLERAQIAAVVGDVDAGRIRTLKDLPELLLVDEQSKRALDGARVGKPAHQLVAAVKSQTNDLLQGAGLSGGRDAKSRDITAAVSGIADTVGTVASGALLRGVDHERREYAQRRSALGRALTAAGVDEPVRGQIREAIDAGAREAGHLGKAAAERDQQWDTKFERLAMMRDDAARTAASSPSRNCTARPDKNLAQSKSAAPARVGGRRNLRQAGAER